MSEFTVFIKQQAKSTQYFQRDSEADAGMSHDNDNLANLVRPEYICITVHTFILHRT